MLSKGQSISPLGKRFLAFFWFALGAVVVSALADGSSVAEVVNEVAEPANYQEFSSYFFFYLVPALVYGLLGFALAPQLFAVPVSVKARLTHTLKWGVAIGVLGLYGIWLVTHYYLSISTWEPPLAYTDLAERAIFPIFTAVSTTLLSVVFFLFWVVPSVVLVTAVFVVSLVFFSSSAIEEVSDA